MLDERLSYGGNPMPAYRSRGEPRLDVEKYVIMIMIPVPKFDSSAIGNFKAAVLRLYWKI